MTSNFVESGNAALAEAAWEQARLAFVSALADQDSAEAHDGLGTALWWLGNMADSLAERERAYVMFLEQGDATRAAGIALWIAAEHASAYGPQPVSAGWFARAERLLADAGPCREFTRLLIARARRSATAKEAFDYYQRAMKMARDVGDRDLELFSLSAIGCWLVTEGNPDEGFAYLDEAMTAVTAGECRDHQLIALTSCNMLLACERAHDMARAGVWLRASEGWARRRHCLPFFAFCRTIYGGVLFTQGRWSEAEDQLVDAQRRYEATHPALSARAAIKLAELRIAQGQLDAAENLLAPWRDQPLAACAVAGLQLARGEAGLAVSRLERRIDVDALESASAVPLAQAIVEAYLAHGDRERAGKIAQRIGDLAAAHPNSLLSAIAESVLGEIKSEAGDPAAIAHLQHALDLYSALEMPYPVARTRLGLARALAPMRKEDALAEARAALAAFESLGALPCAELAAHLVAELSGREQPTIRRRSARDELTRREAEVLKLLREGLSNPEIADRLDISAKTAEHHVGAILSKLDLKTRAAAAAWAERQEKSLP